MNFFILKFDVP